MTRVDVRMIEGALSILSNFNRIPFEELELTLDGKILEISEAVRENWKFIGMCNSTFVELKMWEGTIDEAEPDVY